MKKKINVRKHFRKWGNKKVKVKSHKRKNKINKKKRKVFTDMAKQPYELGGMMDFENGDLENAKTHFGSHSELEFDWDPDYEIDWHTHPKGDSSMLPSAEDIITMQETKSKEQIIFHGKFALSISESKKFQNLPKNKIIKVWDKLHADLLKGYPDLVLYKKYKPIFKKELGLNMVLHLPGRDIKLDTRSI